jgi:hypothetical protein
MTQEPKHIIHPNGTQEWWVNGKRHREDGPAIINSHNYQEWWVNGKRHRLDGPAYINNGRQDWYLNGKRHRTDGPAVIYPDDCRPFTPVIYPDDWREWFINDKNITQEVRNWMKNQNITWPWDWNEEIQAQFILTFC